MINSKYFFKGLGCIKSFDSPAIALGCCMVAIGALLKNIGFNLQESVFSTFLTYALPGSLVMAETMIIGGSLLNIFFAVWLVNSRLYPMTVSLMPLMMHKNQPKWKYYISCHFVAVSAWLIMKNNYKFIAKENRIDYWIGVGAATWSISIVATIIGIPLGVLSAIRRGSFLDLIGRTIAMLGYSLPTFWVGIVLILIFAVWLGWLPAATMGTSGALFPWKYLILPGITLGWVALAGYVRLVRSAMLEIMDSEYIKLARAKGVSEFYVICKH